jgi:hypothetical protein
MSPYFAKKKSSDFVPAPEGLHYAVCADVVGLGIVKTSWQGQESLKDKVRLVWQTEDKMTLGAKAGQPYLISKRYTSSTHPKATLRIHCTSWRGKAFTDEEFALFDIEKLIGVCCQIQITHNVSGGDTYANIMAIVPPPKGRPPLKVSGYTRVKDRPGYVPPEQQPIVDESSQDHGGFPGDDSPPITVYEDEIPF